MTEAPRVTFWDVIIAAWVVVGVGGMSVLMMALITSPLWLPVLIALVACGVIG